MFATLKPLIPSSFKTKSSHILLREILIFSQSQNILGNSSHDLNVLLI